MKQFIISLFIGSCIASAPCHLVHADDHDHHHPNMSTNEVIDPLAVLKEGNERFYTGKATHSHQDSERLKELIDGQFPIAVVVSCSDSRVPPELIFDQGFGDIFSIRTAGNVMADYEEGSVEYAVDHLGTKLIVVMGHESCGAIKAFLDHKDDDRVEGHVASIIQALKDETEEQELLKAPGKNIYSMAIKANIVHAVKQLQESEPVLSEMYKEGKINIIGAIYHIENGQVEFLDHL